MPRPFYRFGWIAWSDNQLSWLRSLLYLQLWSRPFPTTTTAFLSTIAGLIWHGEHLSLFITNTAMFVWLFFLMASMAAIRCDILEKFENPIGPWCFIAVVVLTSMVLFGQRGTTGTLALVADLSVRAIVWLGLWRSRRATMLTVSTPLDLC
ncbi:hypothetical protein OIDMADRAFT_33430 [Oidiodendron maius Zn]|uniref:Uncharacterized protein n=1 Tax=Oidiodendron maius (strain Zn) TaxID=913774 RepID=A0A0C3D2A0_OIDMZ|nr:hypothetical protein OIDMADRAFT_33430 [Oidiodendron maius Zn]